MRTAVRNIVVVAVLALVGAQCTTTVHAQAHGLSQWPSPPNHAADIEHVDEVCPGLVLQDRAFTDAAASYLAIKYPGEGWGLNAKRGNAGDPSHDAIWAPGPTPLGGYIIDIIVAAGGPGARPGWIDQTGETVRLGTTGGYIRPSGNLPDCLKGGGPGEEPYVPPEGGERPPVSGPGPGPGPDITGLQAQLAEALSQLAIIRAELRSKSTQADTEALYRLVADTVIDVHIRGLVERLAQLQADLQAQLDAVKAHLDGGVRIKFR